MISREKIQSLYKLAAMGGGCGLLLLVRPLIYTIIARRRDPSAYASVDASAVVFILYAAICFFFAAKELNHKEKHLDATCSFIRPSCGSHCILHWAW